jgi:phage tail-like protein
MTVYVAELPAAYVDAISLTLAPALELANRAPFPGEDHVSPGTQIVFTLYDTAAAAGAPAPGVIKVYVDATLAYDGPGSGFMGQWVGSAIDNPSGNSTRFTLINAGALFNSSEIVSVRVIASSASGTVDQTYMFTITRTDAPPIVAVQSTAQRTLTAAVLARFPANSTASGAASVLNPANWTLQPTQVAAVTPRVTSVVIDRTTTDTTYVVLTLDTEITRGATYTLTIANMADVDGNVAAPPFNVRGFVGYTCPAPLARAFDLWRMIPRKNRRDDTAGDLLRFIACLQEVTDLLLCAIDHFADILDPDVCSEGQLDAMLAGLGNPFSFIDLSIQDKRSLVGLLVALYKQKGTDRGIVNAVRLFTGLEVLVVDFTSDTMQLGVSTLDVDWTLGPDALFDVFAFDVTTYTPANPGGLTLTPAQRTRIRALAAYMKPAYTRFVNLIETPAPDVLDHLVLGFSQLDVNWTLH